jgi:predicted metal-dependent HD superfamily phosphohydrolase
MDNLTRMEERWSTLVVELNPEVPRERIKYWWLRLLNVYLEPHRHYHTLKHIEFGLSRLDEIVGEFKDPKAAEFAWWFHDFVYYLKSRTNEYESSRVAIKAAEDLGLSEAFASRIEHLIMATVHPMVPEGRDEQLLHDLDISILGEDWNTQLAYRKQIREEYLSAYSPEEFRVGRIAFLRAVLTGGPIFCTELFRSRFEKRARRNIERELLEATR